MTFKCERCGYCCTLNVILTEKEIKKITQKGFADFFVKDENDDNNGDNSFLIKRKENGDCIFLKRNGDVTSCQIYPFRPSPCKNYPPYEQNRPCKGFNPRVRAYLYRTRDKS